MYKTKEEISRELEERWYLHHLNDNIGLDATGMTMEDMGFIVGNNSAITEQEELIKKFLNN